MFGAPLPTGRGGPTSRLPCSGTPQRTHARVEEQRFWRQVERLEAAQRVILVAGCIRSIRPQVFLGDHVLALYPHVIQPV